jgi:hypothetical protein
VAKPVNNSNLVGVDPYANPTPAASVKNTKPTTVDPAVDLGVKQEYAPIAVQTYADTAADPGSGSLYTNELDSIPAIYSRANVYVNQVSQTYVTRNTVLEGGGTGNPFNQDLNTYDSVRFSSAVTPSFATSEGNPAVAIDTTGITVNNIFGKTNTSVQVTIPTGLQKSWYGIYGDFPTDESDDYASCSVYDSEGNVFLLVGDSNVGYINLVKLTSAGSLIWQKELVLVSPYKTADALAIDSDDNVYAGIVFEDAGTGENKVAVVKLTSDGEIVWQNAIDESPLSVTETAVTNIQVDTNQKVYVSLYSTNTIYVAKIDSDGSLLWVNEISKDGIEFGNAYATTLAVDLEENIYLVGHYRYPTQAPVYGLIVKLNYSGQIEWQRHFTSTAGNINSSSLTLDNLSNLYASFTTVDALPPVNFLIKLNSTDGSIIWQRALFMSPDIFKYQAYSGGLAVDADNNIYNVIENRTTEYDDTFVIVKYDSDSNIVWQRKFEAINNGDIYYWWYWGYKAISVYGLSYLINGYFYTNEKNSADAFAAQFPTDGTGTGTYADFSYTAVSLDDSAEELTPVVDAFVSNQATVDYSASTFTVAAASQNYSLTSLSAVEYSWGFTNTGQLQTPNYALPYAAGTTGQVLTVGGSGELTWTTPAATETVAYNSTSRSIYLPGASLQNNNGGTDNIALGSNALQNSQSTSTHNIAIGTDSAQEIFQGNHNIGIGYEAEKSLDKGLENIAIGLQAIYGAGNQFSSFVPIQNIGIGTGTLYGLTEGDNNIAVGTYALGITRSGSYNLGIGFETQLNNRVGSYNISLGYQALYDNRTSDNIAIGYQSSYYVYTGTNNISIGKNSLFNATTGSWNIAIGLESLYTTTSGQSNIALGERAGRSVTNGSDNIYIGRAAGYGRTDGVIIGNGGSQNVAIGLGAIQYPGFGMFNVAVGSQALQGYAFPNPTGVQGAGNTGIGAFTLPILTTGQYNTGLGYGALNEITTGSFNTAVGYFSLQNLKTTSGIVAVGNQSFYNLDGGTEGTAIGFESLYSNTTGSNNTGLGYRSLYLVTTGATNIGIGRNAGNAITTGSNNTIIGNLPGTSALADTVLIGAGATERVKVDTNGLYINGVLQTQAIPIAASDETTPITAGAGKVTFRMPYGFRLTGVRASLTTAQASGNIFTVDINENGTSILSTKLTINNTEKTSVTAAAPAVISDATLADDSEITIDVDQIGDGTATGLKVYLIGVVV